jgi:outer membrane protein OmpA-like peptidoglycan-associated protein
MTRVLLGLFFLCVCAMGCGGNRPMPDELQRLDDLHRGGLADNISSVVLEEIEDPAVHELRSSAIDNFESSEVYHDNALDAFGQRKDDNAVLLARIGLIYFGAAENYHRSAEARERLSGANRAFEDQRQRRNEYAERLDTETELISLLTTVEALFAQNEELRRQLATVEQEVRTESRALYAIQEARIQQRQAEGMRADEIETATFDTATATLARAQGLFDDGEFDLAYQAALESVEQYGRVIAAAEPQFLEDRDRLMRDDQNRAIFEEAVRIFGDEAAFIDARGVVVVLPALFSRGGDEIRDSRVYLVDEALRLLRDYANREVLVEGHTQSSGSSDDNSNLSQARADVVQDYLLERGIRSSRLTTAGFGENAPRYDERDAEGRRNNDRVEIVFLFD